MSKSMSVTFDDGTSHTFDDVPDYVTQEQADARAAEQFPDKKIAGADAATPDAMSAIPKEPQLGDYMMLNKDIQQIAGGAAVPIQIAANHPTEAAGLAALYKFGQGVNAYKMGKETDRMAALEKAAKQAETAAGHQGIQQQKINLKAGIPPGPIAPSPIVGANGLPIAEPIASPATTTAQTAQQIAQPAEQGLVGRMRALAAQQAVKFGQASPMLAGAGRIAGRALPIAGTAIGATDTYNRFQNQDYVGAGLSGLGTAAGVFPGIGTAVNLGTTAINAGRDYSKYIEAKKKFEAQQKITK